MLPGQERDLTPEIAQIERRLIEVRNKVERLASRLERPWWQSLKSKAKHEHRRHQHDALQTCEAQLAEALAHCRDPARCAIPRAIPPHVIPPLKAIPPTVILPLGPDPNALRVSLSSHLRFTPKKNPIWLLTNPSCPETNALAEAAARACPRRLTCLPFAQGESHADALNRAFLAARGDVILLDERLRVSGQWLQQLREAAHSAPEVALCTPVASLIDAQLWEELAATPPGLGFDDLQSIWQLVAASPPPSPDITAAPPCLFIRRDALAALGFLSSSSSLGTIQPLEAFIRRARAAGWCATTSHTSFSSQLPVAPAPQPAPGAPDPSADAGTLDPWALALRQQAAAYRRPQLSPPPSSPRSSSLPNLLFIVFKGGGGTPQTSWDLALALSHRQSCFYLEVDSDQWLIWQLHEGENTQVGSVSFPSLMEWDLPPDPLRAKALRQLIDSLQVGLIHLRHFLGLYPEVVAEISALDIPVVVSIHDFYTICPNGHLIDASQQYCAGQCTKNISPEDKLADCDAVSLAPVAMTTTRMRPSGVLAWRDRTGSSLEHAAALITTSPFAAQLLGNFFPSLEGRIEVIEHGRDLPWQAPAIPSGWPPQAGIKLAVVGHITSVKGGPLLAELGTLAKDRLPQVEWHFLGSVADPAFRPLESVNHGRYTRDELPALLRSIAPHFILIPSVMIETFSHVLTEAWAAGIPVIANDRGALGERIRRLGGGWLATRPLAAEWLTLLSKIVDDPDDYAARLAEIAAMRPRTIADMANDYAALYSRVSAANTALITSSADSRSEDLR
jgi:glycosyltransferase involved in cell wall biosynthesis